MTQLSGICIKNSFKVYEIMEAYLPSAGQTNVCTSLLALPK